MTHDNPTADEPWHRRQTTYRLLEAVALTGSLAAVLTTYLLLGVHASELNPASALLIDRFGIEVVGLARIAVVLAAFAALGGPIRRWRPRFAAGLASGTALVSLANGANDLLVLARTGLPESFFVGEAITFAAVVVGAAVVGAGRREIAVGIRATRDLTPACAPSPQATAAVAFALVLVVSGVGPFAGLGVIETDHSGVASAQTEMIYSGSDDSTVRALDASDGSETWTFSGHSDIVQTVKKSPDGSTVYSGSSDNTVKAVDASDGSEIWTFGGHTGIVESVSVSPNGEKVFSASGDATARAINATDGSEIWTTNLGNNGRSIATAPDGSVVYVADSDSTVYALDTSDGSEIWNATYSEIILTISESPSDDRIYMGDTNGKIIAVDASDGSEIWNNTAHSAHVRGLSASPDGSTLFSASSDDKVKALDTSDGTEIWNFSGHTGNVWSVSAAPDGSTVYSGSLDNTVKALDASDGTEIWTSTAHTDSVRSVSAYSTYESGHPISGTVTDNGGDPVDGATVSTGTGVSTTTGSDGSYELTVENTGTYDLTASTAIDSETQTVDVPDGGLTGVNFSLQSGTVAGTVTDQNGNPVANATVTTLTYNTKDPNVDIDLEELREIVENPLPPQWENFTNQDGVTSEELTINRENVAVGSVAAADGWDSPRVLLHTPSQWELDGYGWPPGDTVAVPQADLLPPQVAVDSDSRPVFTCWEPTDGIVDSLTQNNIESSISNMRLADCDEITVEKLDPTGGVQNTATYSPQPHIRIETLFDRTWPISEGETIKTARPDLEPGIYRVYPDDNQDAAMTYAVAPDANPEKIANNIVNVTNSEIDARTAYLEEIKAQHDAGNIDIKTTTTNDRGEFSFEIDDTVVEEVELRAAKSGTGLEAQLASGELNRQQLADDFEDTVRGEFNTFDKSSVRFSEADVGTQEFGDVCRQMGSVADDLGAPYTGSASTEVPNPDVTIQGQRAPIPEGVSQPVRECAVLNYAQTALEDPGSLLPGLAGDIADMAQDELEGHYENIVNLLKGNEELGAVVEDELGRDLPEDPSELDRDEIETVVRDGLDTVDNPSDDVDVGEPDDSPVPDLPGGDDEDAPSVDDPVEEIDDRVNETITREWPITGVDDWEEAGLLIRIDYADGTSETLSRDSEYVTLDESAVGPDTIRLEEYPFGEGDSAVANIRLDVSTPQGIGGEETPVRNPTFDGTVPGLDSIRLSDSAPGPSDAVTVGVTPAESSQFGQLQTVNVTGPQCSRSIQASDGDATFTTCGAGPHRVAATFTNADGVQFTEVLSVKAGNAAQARDPLIRGAAGPTGRFAVAANGLESGRIDVTAGTSEVILTGIVPADADIPNRVKASTTGVDVARGATTTVRIRQGPNEQTIRDRIGVVLHTSAVGNESLLWRNGRPIRNPGDTASSTVEHFNDSTAVDTYTGDTATVRVEVDRDPSFFDEFRHSVQLRFAGVDIPFLSVQPTTWLTTLGNIGDGLPAPVQVGGGPLVLLGGGVAAARRVEP
jgi:outer membrane protein assembly factor BamB